ncbi:MAG: 30S ribosome-binding factor RbfA [Candidatus Hydrogenedentes bacterium]|nr:30S ribosome-binding factor RbfA [Candidatus Hydrogenedentota bacterium]
MSTKGRAKRVGELIRHEIAGLLTKGLKDPRIGFVSVMDVEMSKDLHYATVNVSLYGDEKERKSSLIALQNSAGWIRREIGKHVRLRFTPEIRFKADGTLDHVYALEKVFEEIQEDRKGQPMIHVDLPGVVDALKSANSFLITSHVSPDGDAVGSVLALKFLLEALGKTEIVCALTDPVPAIYSEIPGAGAIRTPDAEIPNFDVAVIVDVARLNRVGSIADWIGENQQILVIDHHLEEHPDGNLGYIDATYAATGEIMVDLFDAAGVELTPDAAYCAYVAQITDTGGYRYANTNARSHRIAARLHEVKIDHAAICSDVFDMFSRPKIHLMKTVLDRMELSCGGQVATSYVTQEDIEEVGGKKEDLNGLVNYLRNIDGVVVGILLTGVEPRLTKASVRSGHHFNAATFLKPFGGGGHAGAAGVTLELPVDEARERLLDRLRELLEPES